MEEKVRSVICNPYRPLNGAVGGSETSFGLNALVLLLSAVVTATAYLGGLTSYVSLFAVLVASLLVLTVALEWAIFRRRAAVCQLTVRRKRSWKRIAYRELALLATFGVIGFAYWLLPIFDDRAMQICYFPFLSILFPFLLVMSVPYFWFMDTRDEEEEDVLCRIGRAFVTRRKTVTRFELGNYVRSWIVKAFWLGVMQPPLIEKMRIFICYRWSKLAHDPLELFLMLSAICYAMDLCYAASGYLLNLKAFNTHTRTAEPTLLGWVAGLFCYWPFWGILFYPYFFKYEMPTQWHSLFATGGVAWWCWGAAILAFEALYAFATISAGIRFSNLTYRGLWNTGPYRWTKHPAYVFKGLSWWLIYVPFFVNSGAVAVKCTLLLVGVNLVYFLRARTEERHLSHYPEYVAYALSMNERSVFRWCARILPFLKYRPPAAEDRLFDVSREVV